MRKSALWMPMLALAGVSHAAGPIRVMLLDGESGGPYHKWKLVTPVLQKQLEETGLFQRGCRDCASAGGDFGSFRPDFAKYGVVVWNYDAPDDRWSEELKASFEKYVREGGGVVIVHAADNAFRQLDGLQRNDRRGRLARAHQKSTVRTGSIRTES